ncbi:MAG: hypothetical protein GY710_15845 [Desulfobacteraceae bacterium]|nr:hypothetical protein [Desulfobacteraceae bacterium]
MAWPWVTTISKAIDEVFGLVKEPIVEWQKRKTIKVQADTEVAKLYAVATVEKAKAIVAMAKNGQVIDADWDTRAQEQAKFSWKDEALLLLLFSPVGVLFLSAFFPVKYQAQIIAAVKALEEFPTWYVVMLLGIVASVFGLRWLIGPLVQKILGKKPDSF